MLGPLIGSKKFVKPFKVERRLNDGDWLAAYAGTEFAPGDPYHVIHDAGGGLVHVMTLGGRCLVPRDCLEEFARGEETSPAR